MQTPSRSPIPNATALRVAGVLQTQENYPVHTSGHSRLVPMSQVSGAVNWHAPPAQYRCSPEHYAQPVGAKNKKTDIEVLQYGDSPVWFRCIGEVISGTLCRVTGWLQQSSLAMVYHVTFGRVLGREKMTPARRSMPKEQNDRKPVFHRQTYVILLLLQHTLKIQKILKATRFLQTRTQLQYRN